MYSFFAIAASGDSQCTTVGRMYSARPSFTRRSPSRCLAVTSVTPGSLISASIDFEMASAMPGTVNGARLASGSSGGSGRTEATRCAIAFAISRPCRLTQMPEQLMQPRPLFANTLSTITSRCFSH